MSSIPNSAIPHAKPADAEPDAKLANPAEVTTAIEAASLNTVVSAQSAGRAVGEYSRVFGSGIERVAAAYLQTSQSAALGFLEDLGELALVRTPAQLLSLQARTFDRGLKALLAFLAAPRQVAGQGPERAQL